MKWRRSFKIRIKRVLENKQSLSMWTRIIRFGTRTTCGILGTWHWIFVFHKFPGITWGPETRFLRKDSDPWNYLQHCAAWCTNSTWQHFASVLKHKIALKVWSRQKMTTPALCLVLMSLSPVRATPISSWQLRPWHHPSCRASEDGQPLQYLLVKCWPTLTSCKLPLSAIMIWTGHFTVLICFTLRHCSNRPHNTPSFFVF
jgi:hypothetical protein